MMITGIIGAIETRFSVSWEITAIIAGQVGGLRPSFPQYLRGASSAILLGYHVTIAHVTWLTPHVLVT